MLKNLKAIFEINIVKFKESPTETHSLALACAALLVEIGRADEHVSKEEHEMIVQGMAKTFDLSAAEVYELVVSADAAVQDAVSLYDFTAVINEQFSREQKVDLIKMLWEVAYADEKLDHYEEYYVRKIAELLHVSHKDYIRTKLRVQS